MLRSAFCVFILAIHLALDVQAAGLVELFTWKQIDYENRGEGSQDLLTSGGFIFPSDGLLQNLNAPKRQSANDDSQSYIAYNNVPMGANHYKGRLFVTVPRRRLGIPSTLNYIDLKKAATQRNPKLIAYPDLETNTLTPDRSPNENRVVSVYRTRVDACNRLWFIDTGLLELPNNRTQVQRPSIWLFDMETNRRLHRFEIPSSVVGMGNGLASITIDVEPNNCDKAFAYIPDLANNAVYVYSLGQNRIWTFRHNYFHFDPTKGDLSIGGQEFTWDDGVFSITLGNRLPNNTRLAYFHAMASTNEFTVPTSVLQTESNAARSFHGQDFQLLGSRGPLRQSTMHDFDPKSETIFYAEIMRNGVGCWNTKKDKFSAQSHGQVAVDTKKMIYPSDLTIDNEGYIWVMTNSMPIFIYSQLNPNEVNFRVWKQSVSAAVDNTVCAN